eukprot:828145-Karenia_brevis.AAC.1
MSSSSNQLDGRQRRRLGKKRMQGVIASLKDQVCFMRSVIEEQQQQLDAYEAAHASPVLFDANLDQ